MISMISTFLFGLLSVVWAIAVIPITVLGLKWFKNYVNERLKNHEKHKVAFADTREIVNEYLAQKLDNAGEISMDDLEKMCAKTPYVAANIDIETGKITEYEGITAKEVDVNFKAFIKRQDGMIIVEG